MGAQCSKRRKQLLRLQVELVQCAKLKVKDTWWCCMCCEVPLSETLLLAYVVPSSIGLLWIVFLRTYDCNKANLISLLRLSFVQSWQVRATRGLKYINDEQGLRFEIKLLLGTSVLFPKQTWQIASKGWSKNERGILVNGGCQTRKWWAQKSFLYDRGQPKFSGSLKNVWIIHSWAWSAWTFVWRYGKAEKWNLWTQARIHNEIEVH